jgi:hypothetical protein
VSVIAGVGHQHLVAADGDVGANLEVSPAQPVLDLHVALPDPVLDPVGPRDLGQAWGPGGGCHSRAGRRPGQVGEQTLGGLVRQGGAPGRR